MPHTRNELGSTVRGDILWEAEMSEYIVKQGFVGFKCSGMGIEGYKFAGFGETVHGYQNTGEAVRWW